MTVAATPTVTAAPKTAPARGSTAALNAVGVKTPTASTVVEPEALAALQRMGQYLSTLSSFEVKTTTTLDLVTNDGQRIQLDGGADYRVKRPDGFVVERPLVLLVGLNDVGEHFHLASRCKRLGAGVSLEFADLRGQAGAYAVDRLVFELASDLKLRFRRLHARRAGLDLKVGGPGGQHHHVARVF